MIELLVIGGLVFAGLAVAAVVSFVFLILKLVFWAVFLPFRILLKILMIPVWIAMGVLGAAAAAVAVPLVLVVLAGVAVVGLVATVLAILLPALPFVLLGLMLWAIFRSRPVPA